MIKALLWNEWRQKRANILQLFSGLMVVWAILWLAAWLMPRWMTKDIADGAFLILSGALTTACIIFGRSSIAMDSEKNTLPLLLGLPVSASQIFWSKYSFSMCMIMFFVVLNMILGKIWIHHTSLDGANYLGGIILRLTWLVLPIQSMSFTYSLMAKQVKMFAVIVLSLAWFILWLAIVLLVSIVMSEMGYPVYIIFPAAIISALVILSLIQLLHGWYLWVYKISRGLRISKELIHCALGLLVISVVLYGLLYGYGWSRLSLAKNEAIKLGIIAKDDGLMIPDSQNAGKLLTQFNRDWDRIMNKNDRDILASLQSNAKITDEQRKILEKMNSPSAKKMGELLDQALQRPFFRIHPGNMFDDGSIIFYQANKYLLYLAGEMSLNHNNSGILSCIQKMCLLYDMQQESTAFAWSGICFDITCKTAIYHGPETTDSVPVYREIIARLNRMSFFWMESYLDISRVMPKALRIYLAPAIMTSFARKQRYDIEGKKLIDSLPPADKGFSVISAEAVKLAIREKGYNNTEKKLSINQNPIYLRLKRKTIFMASKLALAAKIYRIENGVFPEKIEQLTPSILPELPRNTLTGKYFDYQRKDNGFVITGKDESNSNVVTIDYQPLSISPEINKETKK